MSVAVVTYCWPQQLHRFVRLWAMHIRDVSPAAPFYPPVWYISVNLQHEALRLFASVKKSKIGPLGALSGLLTFSWVGGGRGEKSQISGPDFAFFPLHGAASCRSHMARARASSMQHTVASHTHTHTVRLVTLLRLRSTVQ